MPLNRMNRDEFFAKLAGLDEDRIKKALWNLYWRGPAQLRERIESELDPAQDAARKRVAAEPPDPDTVLWEVRDFAELARAGAYMAGDRRVSPKERTRWRLTFRRLAADALAALRHEDCGPAEEAVAILIDLACETKRFDYFRSEDPMESAQFVVSDAVATLWEFVRERHGFARFATVAAAQLPRWESAYGWSRSGWGKLAKKETSLATVLGRTLRAPDAWTAFADTYLDALDQIARAEAAKPASRPSYSHPESDYRRSDRTRDLAEWHSLLLERLAGSEAEDRLDRLAGHPALGGPELTFVQARLAQLRGDTDAARTLAEECLGRLPGHDGFADFAVQIGAELPASTRDKLAERARWPAATAPG
ncbi:MAG TPA: hypothetical protein VMV17_05125 [Streptosporangiaceae bacterium]|nr:hypothetical protein [Streptosporangiaceae bacterium]